MDSEQTGARSLLSRALAERVLINLAGRVGDRCSELVVIGGLVPMHLAGDEADPHQGTVDVDLLLQLALDYDRDDQDFGWLEAAVRAAQYTDSTGEGWRWKAPVDDTQVKVEFLCDVGTDRRESAILLPGCQHLAAWNLAGPGAALRDAEPRRLLGPNSQEVSAAAALARALEITL